MRDPEGPVGEKVGGGTKPAAGRKARRLFFSLMIGSVALSGLLGIVALVIGRFDDLQARVLLTSLAVTAGCIGILAGALAVERGWTVFGKAAAGLALVATAGLISAVWAGNPSETLWQVVATLWVFSAASVLVCLTVLVRPAPRYRFGPRLPPTRKLTIGTASASKRHESSRYLRDGNFGYALTEARL